MLAFLFTACLVGPAVWFLIFVVAGKNSRSPSTARQALPARGQLAPDDGDGLNDTATPMWTALDDHQLTRLLKGPAS
jgi:hypothetical protein